MISVLSYLGYTMFLLVILIDVVALVWAVYEFIGLPHKSSRWASSKILYPDKPNGKPSIVLVHGFTGSPFDFKYLSLELRGKGFRVLVPEVPGQGDRYFALIRGKYDAHFFILWLDNILELETKRTGQKPWIVGFSMGGTLAAIMASKKCVEKMVLISPYFGLSESYADRFIKYFGKIFPVIPKRKIGTINDPDAYKKYVPGSMLISISAFLQLRNLVRIAVESAEKITIPTLVLSSKNDEVASHKRTADLFSTKSGFDLRDYNRGNHILLFDYDRTDIICDILKFLN